MTRSYRSRFAPTMRSGCTPGYQQTQHAALHMAVSFWRRQEAAIELAKRFPKHGGSALDPGSVSRPQDLASPTRQASARCPFA